MLGGSFLLTVFNLKFSTGCDIRESKGTRPEGKDSAMLGVCSDGTRITLKKLSLGTGMAITHDAFHLEHLGIF